MNPRPQQLRFFFPLALLTGFLLLLAAAPSARAERALLTEAAVQTRFCNHCAPGGLPSNPPPEGQIEGACGIALAADGSIYLSDYYHRVIDHYASSGIYQSQIVLSGTNPVFGTNTLDAVCGLAVDAAGNLYAEELHRRVLQLTPSEVTIDTGESTGLAIDPTSNRLFTDDRTHIAEYALPFSAEDQPLREIGTDPGADYYGLAAFEGRIYVADASDQTVKIFEPAASITSPVHAISGFKSLAGAGLAVDPTNGHLLLTSNVQPLFEHPKSQVHEFAAAAEGYVDLGVLPGAPVFGAPSGIAVGPDGTAIVTDGNDELANAFAYGPYEGAAPLASTSPVVSAATSSAGQTSAPSAVIGPSPIAASRQGAHPRTREHHRHRRRAGHRHGAGGRR